ncbi:MAG: heavy-metal-associated domain-containing protein [Bacteroidales bacterium]|jgi:Cu(I)/Ag(I) efflux system membrane fusion protein|nr:heavy-metal-associated domain-containing protein [Bacteroidales bacterium]
MKKSIILFSVIGVWVAGACVGRSNTPQQASAVHRAEATHAVLKVKGACDMCKARIEKASKNVEGVTGAAWNRETQTLHFQYHTSETSVDTLSKAIAKTGHDTEKDKAPDDVYAALPGCCRYR